MQPTAWDFQNRLMAILNGARQTGKAYIEVESGRLHTQVGEHPHLNSMIPVCCAVMRSMMRPGDSILNESPNSEDATLLIRYMVQASGTHAGKDRT